MEDSAYSRGVREAGAPRGPDRELPLAKAYQKAYEGAPAAAAVEQPQPPPRAPWARDDPPRDDYREPDDDEEAGGTRRKWQKKRGTGGGGGTMSPASPAQVTPGTPVGAPVPVSPPHELHVRTRDDDRGSRTGSNRRSKAEELLEQTKQRYSKYLKDRNLEGRIGIPEEAGKPPRAEPPIPRAPEPAARPYQPSAREREVPPRAPEPPTPAHAAAAAASAASSAALQAERARVAEMGAELAALKQQLAEMEEKLRKEQEIASSVQTAQADMEQQLQTARMELLTSAAYEHSLYMAKVSKGESGSCCAPSFIGVAWQLSC